MPDILRTSTSALVAFQRALAVTGNNIANANTDGYSRQLVQLASRPPEGFGNGFVGTGVDVTTVRRAVDQFAVTTLRDSNVQLGQLTTFSDFASRVDNVTGDTNAGLSGSLQSFFNAWQTVANDPASITNRQLLLGQAQSLANRFNQLSDRLASIGADVTTQLDASIHEINSLASSIATLNDQITTAQAAVSGQPANDLLDKRDQLLQQLGKMVNVQTTTDPDGAVNVFIGSGQALVLRAKSFQLQTVPNAFDSSRLDVTYLVNGTVQSVTNQLNGGTVGGLLQVQSELIDPARSALGRLAVGLSQLVNQQQSQGLDLTGALGQPMFQAAGPIVLASSTNTGGAGVTATVSNLSALGTSNYQLRYTGTGWLATDLQTGQAVTVSGTGTAANPLTFGGLSLTVAGTPNVGDQYQVRPTQDVAGTFKTVMTDPRGIAAALPVRTTAGATNLGTGVISSGQVLDATNPNLLATVTISFPSATTYSVNGGPAQAFTAGGNIDVNGWRVQVTGAPSAGDTFTVARNAGGVGDNRNALAMAGLANQGVFDGGAVSVSQAYSSLVATVGNDARQAQVARDAQSAIVNDAQQNVLKASGVNLDEEAADLLKWQQAYGAAAKVVSVANDAFNTLLQAVRGG